VVLGRRRQDWYGQTGIEQAGDHDPEYSIPRAEFIKLSRRESLNVLTKTTRDAVATILYRMTTEFIVLKSDFDRFDALRDELAQHDLAAVNWADREQHLERIRYALVWQPAPGELARMPELAVVFSVGAGIDHLVPDGVVPDGLPVVRMVEESLTAGMVEYVLYQVLRLHREMHRYDEDQRNHRWQQRMQSPATARTVGILGLGELGGAAGEALARLGFNVIGWSRTEKRRPGIESYFGDDQLDRFLGRSEFLVCLLPLTSDTAGIIDRDLLRRLPRGGFFINAGRGPLVNDADLLAALDDGRLAAACLDVFNQEPLPGDSPYWDHPRVTLTPHVASMTIPETSIQQVVANIARFRAGQPLHHLADLSRGY